MQGKETDMKAAVLMKSGYEEGETLTIVDLLRRAGFECDTFYFDEPFVEGMHHMLIKADQPFHENTIKEYDLLILPGGRPGGANLANDPRVIELVRSFDAKTNIWAPCVQERWSCSRQGFSKNAKSQAIRDTGRS